MTRRRGDCDVELSYTYEDEENNRNLEFEIAGTVSAYDPGRCSGPPEDCYPPEGGMLEDIEVRLVDADIYDDNGNTIRTFKDLSKDEIKAIEDDFDRLANGVYYDRLNEMAWEEADGALEAGCDDYDEDDRYERYSRMPERDTSIPRADVA